MEGLVGMRNTTLALAALLLGAAVASAQGQGWAEKMFKEGTAHDFGAVPRGAQLFHRFPITNIYAVRMEITGIVPGCGCVTATASKRVLEPRETAYLDVTMDAHRFTGPKAVIIRVTVGPEFTSSAEIKVSANSRADIVFNPGQVGFGNVLRGQTPTQAVEVEYAGALAWRVSELVPPKDAAFDADIKELYRTPGKPGKVGYQIKVTLKPDAPPGALKQTLYLKTNDPATPLVPLLVEAILQSAVTVSPAALSFGGVKAGDELTRKVVVRGTRPFKILAVDGLGDGVILGNEPTGAATAAVQTVAFKCKFTQTGEFHRELKIKTDLQDAPVVVTLDGTAAP
jgi:hypothetical protein